MTSLEWRTLWQISESTPVFELTEGGPVIRFHNLWDGIPGNNSAAAALLDGGMVRLPRFRRDVARPVALTARGRRALRTASAARHRPRPQIGSLSSAEMFDRTRPAWLERHIAGDWFLAESYCRQLWLLEQGVSGAARDADHTVPGRPQSLFYLSDFIDRGYAQQREAGAVITPAGRDVLKTRPDLTVVFEAETRVRRAHGLHYGTAEEMRLHNVSSQQGLYLCVCGWFLIFDDPVARQWADEFPAAEHWSRLTDTEVLAMVREREGAGEHP